MPAKSNSSITTDRKRKGLTRQAAPSVRNGRRAGPRTVHPGEVLREELMRPLGLSANRLARDLRVTVPRINDVVRDRRAMTADLALRLARYFGTSPEFWMNLQALYEIRRVQADRRIAGELTRISRRRPAA
jgi:addiction module HigA family antidote